MIRIKGRFFEFLFFSNIVLVMNEYLHIRTQKNYNTKNKIIIQKIFFPYTPFYVNLNEKGEIGFFTYVISDVFDAFDVIFVIEKCEIVVV